MGEEDPDVTRIHSSVPLGTPPLGKTAAAARTGVAGDYILGRHLGTGGFAEVYLAEDRRTGRQVALKQLLPGPAGNTEIVRRFSSVAELTKTLSHPNIITVYGYEVIDRRPSILMEYVPGQSLRQILHEEGVLSVDKILSIALPLCDALTYAHEQGIIHRDVKPDNILVAPDGVVKLGDFDIAKITTSTVLTLTGVRVGTPYYMSPEQLRRNARVDNRSDVFSMGIVLYEMVAGEVPVGRFGHPSELNPELPRRLGSVILKALARDPGSRYGSIQELRDALTGSPEAKRSQEHAFYFRGQGRLARTIGELIEYCEKDWEGARWHLDEGHFDRWLRKTNPKLAREVESSLKDERDLDLALEKLLHLLDTTLPHPVLAVDPEFEIDLQAMAPHETRAQELRLSNPSRGYLVGNVEVTVPWLAVSGNEFRLKEGAMRSLVLLAEAPAELGEYTGQLIVNSNGGRIDVPVRLQTRLRLLFPQAGRSAGSVSELVDLCSTYRDEAIVLFYDMAIERWLEEGPMRFDLVALAQELRQRYGRASDEGALEKGLRAFLLACAPETRPEKPEPFTFRTGEQATTIPELIQLCETYWRDAEGHLYEGHFAAWLELVDPTLVAEAERIQETGGDHRMGVEQFLRLLDPELPSPKLDVRTDPASFSLGEVAPGERRRGSVVIRNVGRGYLSGELDVHDAVWAEGSALTEEDNWSGIALLCNDCGAEQTPPVNYCRECGKSVKSFGCLPGELVSFQLIVSAPSELGKYSASVDLRTNGGPADIEISLQVTRRLLFPEAGVSVGSVWELAYSAHGYWGEARSLWLGGEIDEWLAKGLLRFDLVELADRIRDDPKQSPDMQLIPFLLQACPKSRTILPPYLSVAEGWVSLGTVLNRSRPCQVSVMNLGGANLAGVRIAEQPEWLDAWIDDSSPPHLNLVLVGCTRPLRHSGPYGGQIVLDWVGTFHGTQLDTQRAVVSVHLEVPPSLRIGRWRIPYGGCLRIRSVALPVPLVWVLTIGLVSALVCFAFAQLTHRATMFWAAWLCVWAGGAIALAVLGLGYRSPAVLTRDVLRWLRSCVHRVRLAAWLDWARGTGITLVSRARDLRERVSRRGRQS